jgi:hypothetical protein
MISETKTITLLNVMALLSMNAGVLSVALTIVQNRLRER